MTALLAPLLLGGCGLADTGTVTTAGAQAAAQQAVEARKTEDRVRQQLDAAMQQDAEKRQAADAVAQ